MLDTIETLMLISAGGTIPGEIEVVVLVGHRDTVFGHL